MLVKVCGMREAGNIREVDALGIDFMGFIFYAKSARSVGQVPVSLPENCSRVGVFVNAETAFIVARVKEFGLRYVQLHGDEEVEAVRHLREVLDTEGLGHVKLMRAVAVSSVQEAARARRWDGLADLLLFETPTTGYGGSGCAFNWELLSGYEGQTPFLLAGGIGLESMDRLRAFKHPRWVGVDLNSKFETAPGKKDVARLRQFIHELKKQKI